MTRRLDLAWSAARLRWRSHCPHSDLRPIYGDEINYVGGWRLQCRDCARFLDGPVRLAEFRRREVGR